MRTSLKTVLHDLHLSVPLRVEFWPTHGEYKVCWYSKKGHRVPDLRFDDTKLNPGLERADWPREDCYDPWKVRSDFLFAVDPEDFIVEAFIFFYGRFGWIADLRATPGDPHGHNDFANWKALVTDLLRTPRDRWWALPYAKYKLRYANRSFPVSLQVSPDGKPYGLITVRTAIDAILVSVQLDYLFGLQTRYCASCHREFLLTSRHRRRYCSSTCGVREAVRALRNRQARRRQGSKGRKRRQDPHH